MAQAQLGGTIQILPATMGAPGAGLGRAGQPAMGRASGRSRLAVVLRPAARAERGTGHAAESYGAYADPGFMPLGAPVYGDARTAGTGGYRYAARTAGPPGPGRPAGSPGMSRSMTARRALWEHRGNTCPRTICRSYPYAAPSLSWAR